MPVMPSVLLSGWGLSLRMVVRRLTIFLPSLSKKLGGILSTYLKSCSSTFAHCLRLAFYVGMVVVLY